MTTKTISQKKIGKYVKHLKEIQNMYVREELHHTSQQITDMVATVIPHLKWTMELNEEYENALYVDRDESMNHILQVLQPEYHYLGGVFITVVIDV
jgi:hypothetical protein